MIENFTAPVLFVMVPTLLTLAYWAAHDPASIRLASAELQRVVHVLNAWAKAQDSRKSSYQRAMKRHRTPPTPKVQPTQEVTEC
jgi:hypothetical protein